MRLGVNVFKLQQKVAETFLVEVLVEFLAQDFSVQQKHQLHLNIFLLILPKLILNVD